MVAIRLMYMCVNPLIPFTDWAHNAHSVLFEQSCALLSQSVKGMSEFKWPFLSASETLLGGFLGLNDSTIYREGIAVGK